MEIRERTHLDLEISQLCDTFMRFTIIGSQSVALAPASNQSWEKASGSDLAEERLAHAANLLKSWGSPILSTNHYNGSSYKSILTPVIPLMSRKAEKNAWCYWIR